MLSINSPGFSSDSQIQSSSLMAIGTFGNDIIIIYVYNQWWIYCIVYFCYATGTLTSFFNWCTGHLWSTRFSGRRVICVGYLVITFDSNCLVSEMCGLFGNYT